MLTELTATEPKEIFEKDLEDLCRKGIDIYQTKFQKCAFVWANGETCTIVNSIHRDTHCSTKGTRYKGLFDSSEYQEDRTATIAAIRTNFILWYKELYSTKDREAVLRTPESSSVSDFRRSILSSESLRRAGTRVSQDAKTWFSFWDRAKSNKTCFACLQAAPDHILPCGHGFCDECVRDFGALQANHRYRYALHSCVLCLRSFTDEPCEGGSPTQFVRLIPRCAGIRILTLDGGGVRGIVELALLEKLESRVGLKLPVRELFDLIVGTSTGMLSSALVLAIPLLVYSVSEL